LNAVQPCGASISFMTIWPGCEQDRLRPENVPRGVCIVCFVLVISLTNLLSEKYSVFMAACGKELHRCIDNNRQVGLILQGLGILLAGFVTGR